MCESRQRNVRSLGKCETCIDDTRAMKEVWGHWESVKACREV